MLPCTHYVLVWVAIGVFEAEASLGEQRRSVGAAKAVHAPLLLVLAASFTLSGGLAGTGCVDMTWHHNLWRGS